MNIAEILKNNPELAEHLNVTAKASDLQELAKMCIEAGKQEKPEPINVEEYLTADEFAAALKISLVTLWTWDGKGITQPLKIGKLKRYRRSDLEKIMMHR